MFRGFYVEGFICLGLFQLQKRPDYEYGHWHAGREVVTVTQITEWSKKTGLTGWCLLTGYYPDADTGVVVVDADTPEAIAWCEANLPKTPMVVRSAKGGRHYYYRHPPGRE